MAMFDRQGEDPVAEVVISVALVDEADQNPDEEHEAVGRQSLA